MERAIVPKAGAAAPRDEPKQSLDRQLGVPPAAFLRGRTGFSPQSAEPLHGALVVRESFRTLAEERAPGLDGVSRYALGPREERLRLPLTLVRSLDEPPEASTRFGETPGGLLHAREQVRDRVAERGVSLTDSFEARDHGTRVGIPIRQLAHGSRHRSVRVHGNRSFEVAARGTPELREIERGSLRRDRAQRERERGSLSESFEQSAHSVVAESIGERPNREVRLGRRHSGLPELDPERSVGPPAARLARDQLTESARTLARDEQREAFSKPGGICS